MSIMRSVLTIAGSDSSGGAGIQADLKTIAAHGCYGTSAITALTSQNTTGVQAIQPVPPDFVKKQIYSNLDDIETNAIKTGMLYDADCIQTIADALKTHYKVSVDIPPVVCDPVCVSTSGHTLLDSGAVETLIDTLFPLAQLITPNKAESELLLTHRGLPSKIENLSDMVNAAVNLLAYGSNAVLVKGGHVDILLQDAIDFAHDRPNTEIVLHGLLSQHMETLQTRGAVDRNPRVVADVLAEHDEITIFIRPHINSSSTHGTGCTLSSAIACQLACGLDLKDAVAQAVVYTYVAIQTAFPIGHGHGPVNHMHPFSPRIVPRVTPSDRYPFTKLLIQSSASEWNEYIEHQFVKLLGRGALPREAFIHFIIQDYHYLQYYARAYALLAAKSRRFGDIEAAMRTITNILDEINTHKTFCASFGITEAELENASESAATTAYGAYLIDIGLQGDTMKLLIALLACLLGYGEVGLWLESEARKLDSWVVVDGNPYKRWIDDYSGKHFQSAVTAGLELMESRVAADEPSPTRYSEWRDVWCHCTKFEKGFWDDAMSVV